MLHLRGGGRQKRKPKKHVGGTSHRVADDDDPMDCDYEVKEREVGSRRKAPPRRLSESLPFESEEDDSGDDEERDGGGEDEESTDEGLEFNPRLVVSPIDTSSPPTRRREWDGYLFHAYHRACDLKHFNQQASSLCPCFHTRVQFDLFWGRFEQAPMCTNQN